MLTLLSQPFDRGERGLVKGLAFSAELNSAAVWRQTRKKQHRFFAVTCAKLQSEMYEGSEIQLMGL